jgi:hypothetical protein
MVSDSLLHLLCRNLSGCEKRDMQVRFDAKVLLEKKIVFVTSDCRIFVGQTKFGDSASVSVGVYVEASFLLIGLGGTRDFSWKIIGHR